MKKLLLTLPIVALTLASCGGGGAPPAAQTVSGYWTGTLAGYGSVNIQIGVNQTNTPNSGDFTGTLTATGVAGSAGVAGNVFKGTLVSADSSGYIACAGTFSNYNHYVADCLLAAGSSQMVRMDIWKR
ncbi:hypothetical protein [Deinococcus enclensis]|uniref:Lipoprotein n=1 Tax=Deinococcus enclensis TaxID=1049582 RepID=A0ABT9MJ86_9DEIO|nr:hypothetical protein [Deinococcus enclensis]MDP9766641.1 hypothetical protein [Deinococcus enclensis]